MASETKRRVVVDPLAGSIERRLQLEALDFRAPGTVSGRQSNDVRQATQPKRRKANSLVRVGPGVVPADVLRVHDFVRRLKFRVDDEVSKDSVIIGATGTCR